MVRLICFFIIISLDLPRIVLAATDDGSELIPVVFETLEKGSFPGADTSKYNTVIEIHTANDLAANWKEFRSNGLPISEKPPNIDFINWFVIAVFNKFNPGRCYKFGINNVYLTNASPDGGASVSLEYVLLGAGYGCLAYVAKHYEIIKVKKMK